MIDLTGLVEHCGVVYTRAEEAIRMLKASSVQSGYFRHNGIRLTVHVSSKPEDICRQYEEAMHDSQRTAERVKQMADKYDSRNEEETTTVEIAADLNAAEVTLAAALLSNPAILSSPSIDEGCAKWVVKSVRLVTAELRKGRA
jgi:hypothetical protein